MNLLDLIVIVIIYHDTMLYHKLSFDLNYMIGFDVQIYLFKYIVF